MVVLVLVIGRSRDVPTLLRCLEVVLVAKHASVGLAEVHEVGAHGRGTLLHHLLLVHRVNRSFRHGRFPVCHKLRTVVLLLLGCSAVCISHKAMSLILPLRLGHSLAVAGLVVVLLKLNCAEHLVLLRLLGSDRRRLDRSLDLRAFHAAAAHEATCLRAAAVRRLVVQSGPLDGACVKHTRFVSVVLV